MTPKKVSEGSVQTVIPPGSLCLWLFESMEVDPMAPKSHGVPLSLFLLVSTVLLEGNWAKVERKISFQLT